MTTKRVRKPRAKKTAAEKKPRKQFTPEQRAAILAEAKEQKLTGKQVAAKHGISMVTYYLWRQKSWASGRRGKQSTARRASLNGFSGDIHAVVQAKVREVLPAIVKAEVARAVDSLLGGGGSKRR